MGYPALYSTLHPNHFLLIGAKEKMITGLKLELRRMQGSGEKAARQKTDAELRTEARLCLEEQEGDSFNQHCQKFSQSLCDFSFFPQVKKRNGNIHSIWGVRFGLINVPHQEYCTEADNAAQARKEELS